MDTVLRAFAVYVIFLIMTRISGRRTLSQLTVFDFVLLLLIAETAQNALITDDESLTQVVVLVATLITANVALSLLKLRWRWAALLVDGGPTVLMRDGALDVAALAMARVTRDDILEAARTHHGLSRLEEVSCAVLETCGTISIIPRQSRAG